MNSLSRRSLLAGTVGFAALALAGCAVTKNGTVTTVTLNVARVTTYAQAALNAVSTVTDALALFPQISAYTVPLQAVETVLRTALTNFSAAAGSSTTVTYDDASVKTEVDSVLSAIQSVSSQIASILLAMVKQTTLGLSDKTVSKVQLVADAVATVVSAFEALLSTTVSLNELPPSPRMGEADALRVLNA